MKLTNCRAMLVFKVKAYNMAKNGEIVYISNTIFKLIGIANSKADSRANAIPCDISNE